MKFHSQPLVKMYFRSFLGVSSLFLLLFLLFALVRGGVAAAMVLPFDEPGASAAGQGLLMGEASPDHDTNGTNGTSVCEGSGFVGQSQLYLPLVTSNASNNSHAAASLATNERSQQTIHPLRRVAQAGDNSLKLKVAYLYDADMATGEAFGALLQAKGLQIYLLSLAEVAEAEFSACDLLLLGSDTGSWADEATRLAVLDSERSIMALGEGGLNFLDAAGLLGGIASSSTNATTVEATLRGQSAYEFPNAIALADETVQLYSSASETRVLEISNPLADGIEIGRLPETADDNSGHVAIVQLQERFLLWGFSDAPAQMSQAGQALFVNLLGFQGQSLQLPLRTRHFTPQAGIEQALIDELASTSEPNLHAYVQLKSEPDNPTCDEFSNLTPQGVTVLTYFWGQTYIASVTPEFDAADPLLAACVRWMGRILPEDKVMPKVLANQFEAWADNGDGTVNLLVSFFPDVPDSEASDILATQVSSQSPFGMETWAVVMEQSNISALSQNDRVRWIEEGPAPILPLNDLARQELFVDELQEASIVGNAITYNGLDGTEIAVGVWDVGFDNDHPDFAGRVLQESDGEDDHGTHVSGIIGASGASSSTEGGTPFEWRGMAPEVDFAFYDAGFAPDNVNQALNTHNIKVSNHSYKVICEGRYDQAAQGVDTVLRGDFNYNGSNLRAHPAIWASGNEGDTGQYCADDELGYHSITSPGKNNLTVGAVGRNNDYRLSIFSSRGPTYDGRLKPELMATGRMYSTVPGGGYGWKGGTSMAAPAVTGIAALALEQYGITYGTTEPLPATVKGLLINYATDLVNEPDDPDYEAYNWNEPDTGSPLIYHQGPDFSTGYGVVHARRTVDAVRHKAALEGQLNNANQVDEYTIEVLPSRQELRFTLVWDDPGADPALADSAIHLVNDLELLLIDPNGGLHYPWVLNPPPANANFTVADITAAYHGEDNRNNVEQVTLWVDDVAPADWAGEWTVRVSADSLPVGPQSYSLVGEWREIELPNVYPLDAGFHQAPELVIIPVAVSNPHLAASGASGGLAAEDWAVRVGDSGSNSWSEATVEATYGPVGDQAFLVVRPPNTLDAGIHYDLEVTLLDVYQIDQHTAESQQDIATATQNNALIFSASPRPPVDEMIIMDNSGSMASNNKLDSAQNAARAFADRRQEGDMIGLAYFEDIADTLYDLTLISADESELAAVKQQIDSMSADGNTALGAGLLEGKAQLDSNGNPDHAANIVLLSDGMENVSPCWDSSAGNPSCEGQPSVQDDFVPDNNGCPSIRIDTVTIGPENATWHQLLEDVADKTCGEPWQATVDTDGGLRASLGGTQYFPQALQNTLADIYISIADGNTQQERLWEALHILEVGEQISQTIELEDNLPEVTFALNFSEITSAPFVQLYRPSGVLVNLNDPDVHINSDLTHVVYRIDAPTGGTWRLDWMNTNSNSVPAEYLATVSANTNVTMLLDFGIAPPERKAGATMPLYVILADEAGTLTDAQVELRIRQPGGQLDFLTMYDDGTNGDATANDGVYSNHYLIPTTGNYRVKAFANGIAHDNEPFMRYRQRHFRARRLPSVAYIYDSESEIATQYKNLLDGNGMNVTLIKQSEIENTDFEPYHLILIGPETGTEDNWGNQSQIEQLTEHRNHVLGLGEGGYAFFGKLELDIGYPNGMNASDSQALPLNPTQSIWSQPYEIEIQSGFVSLYNASGSPGIVLDLLQSGPTVERIAQRPTTNSPFDWLASEQSLYFFWGFDRGPDAMTETGQELFVNTAWSAQE